MSDSCYSLILSGSAEAQLGVGAAARAAACAGELGYTIRERTTGRRCIVAITLTGPAAAAARELRVLSEAVRLHNGRVPRRQRIRLQVTRYDIMPTSGVAESPAGGGLALAR